VSLLAPLALLIGLLALPILLLYMLRLRRREVVVSSTFLWQQILRDREANTPWQRLRRSLLLILQLVILALLAFALARPFITVPAVSAARIAVILDASASMSAASGEGTRFDEARAQAQNLVDTMNDGSQMIVIRAAENAAVLAPLTGDRAVLTAAISGAQPASGSADWDAALTLAAANAGGGQDFTTVIISDGGGLQGDASGAVLPPVPGELQYVPVGAGDAGNVAITALAARAQAGGQPQLFAQISNFSDADAQVIFDLRVDGELFTAERLTIPARDSLPVVTADLPAGYTAIRAGITAPADGDFPNALTLDDAAFVLPPVSGTRRVLVLSEGNRFLDQAFRSLPGVEAFLSPPGALPASPFDLYVFDGWLPDTLPDADIMIFNPPDSLPGYFTAGGVLQRPEDASQPDPTANLTVERGDPRMAFVDVSAVNLFAFRQVSAGDWAQTLISADGGPLLLAGETQGRQIALFSFDLRQSDLPLQIAYPILMTSLLDWFAPASLARESQLSVGETAAFVPPADAATLRVALPDGTTRDLPVISTDDVLFADTSQIGLYALSALADGETVAQGAFAVNLFDAGESDLTPYPSITLGESTITPEAGEETGQREFWPWLALAALVVLLLEWLVYHRQRGGARFRPVTLPGLSREGKKA
jgi:Ca-activated chloride channel homolog